MMKVLSITFVAAAMSAVGVQAGMDMKVDFPGVIMPRAEVLNANLMSFTSALAGFSAPAITQSSNTDRPFQVEGSLFDSFANAWQRSCGIQKNLCSDFVNSGRGGSVTVQDCEQQNQNCDKAVSSATATAFATFATSDANFDYYCEP